MTEYKEGVLVYDCNSKRMDIRFGVEEYYGGLHCGECFDIKIEDKWVPVRIEYSDDWYICSDIVRNLNTKDKLSGLMVRI